MCGILGTTRVVSSQDFSKALDLISHRGPDDSASIFFDGVYFGHKRLSIIDLSPLGKQPMMTEDGEYTIVFNGEIYNFKELKLDLEKIGVKFVGNSDTEVILKGYKAEGTSFFQKMRGMWALGIYDKSRNTIVLSRDFFGIKPLYYYSDTDLSFSSELKPLSKLIVFKPDPGAYETYFSLGAMIGEKTGVAGVFQVLPGEVIEFSLVNKDLRRTQLEMLSSGLVYHSLEQALRDSVKKHFVSDVPVSILFSGGIDSSIIASLSKEEGFNPNCFFVEMEGNIDKDYAQSIAQSLDLPFETLSFNNKEFSFAYSEVLSRIDMPTSDISILPTWAIFNKLSKKAKVALSGEGGDELFGGYDRHKTLYGKNFKKYSICLPRMYPNNYFGLRYLAPIQMRVQKIISLFFGDVSALYALEASTNYDPINFKKTVNFLRSWFKGSSYAKKIPDSLFYDFTVYLPYMLMVKGDRASMFNSVEGRVPFLDKELFGYVQQEYINGNQSFFFKKELKKIAEKYLPKSLVNRKKQGFGVSKSILLSDAFKNDFIYAIEFHKERKNLFGALPIGIENEKEIELVLNKYPRFAFSLITSFYAWKNYGL